MADMKKVYDDLIIINLYRQQGNSSIHGSEIRGLSSRAGYNDARTVMENDYILTIVKSRNS